MSTQTRPTDPTVRLATRSGLKGALRVARSHPHARVDAFEPTWDAVDRARDRARALGLDDRVHVWHASAAARVLALSGLAEG